MFLGHAAAGFLIGYLGATYVLNQSKRDAIGIAAVCAALGVAPDVDVLMSLAHAIVGLVKPNGFWDAILVFHRDITHAVPILAGAFLFGLATQKLWQVTPRTTGLGFAVCVPSCVQSLLRYGSCSCCLQQLLRQFYQSERSIQCLSWGSER